jgi:hypothetical protein
VAGVVALYLTWGEMLAQLEQIFSPGPLWVVAVPAALIVIAALVEAKPFLGEANRRLLILGSALLAVAGWVIAAATPAYSQDHQQRFTTEHVTEFPSGRSSWSIVNDDSALPPAYSRLGQWKMGELPFSQRERWLAAAPRIPGTAPATAEAVEVLRQGDSRTIRLRLKANGAERITLLAPADARIEAAGVNGFVRKIGDPDSTGKFVISCSGRSCDGAELIVDQASARPIEFIVAGARNGLPPSAAPLLAGRPSNARPQYTPDETVTVSRVRV